MPFLLRYAALGVAAACAVAVGLVWLLVGFALEMGLLTLVLATFGGFMSVLLAWLTNREDLQRNGFRW